jgi:hypothetical protein
MTLHRQEIQKKLCHNMLQAFYDFLDMSMNAIIFSIKSSRIPKKKEPITKSYSC